jgi:hypothetical protein
MPGNALSPLPLMELATGFWSFKTLASAYQMGLFEQPSGTSGTTAGELALLAPHTLVGRVGQPIPGLGSASGGAGGSMSGPSGLVLSRALLAALRSTSAASR